jgi:hypothetical protein
MKDVRQRILLCLAGLSMLMAAGCSHFGGQSSTPSKQALQQAGQQDIQRAAAERAAPPPPHP